MIERHITPLIIQSLQHFPAVLVVGARQVGKSTLAKQLVEQGFLQDYHTLDDLTTLENINHDPDGFLQSISVPVAIDEIQRVPDLMRALKKVIDEDRAPGRFLLTGSANILSYPGVTESLAGRIDIITLEGLSVAEISKSPTPSTFIPDLFANQPIKEKVASWNKKIKQNTLTKDEMLVRLFFGGFPECALKENAPFSARWFNAYITSYIERDVRDLSRLLDITAFAKLFRLLANRTGNLANIKNIAVDAGIDQRTALRYIEIFEMTYQVTLLKPWFKNSTKRLVKTAKSYLNDSGLACSLLGINSVEELGQHPMLGGLFETFMFSELRKLLDLEVGIGVNFYRTHLGKEVDFVLHKGNNFYGIELKWSQSIGANDFKGLKDMISALDHNAFGVLLYTGSKVHVFSEKLVAVPIGLVLLGDMH